MPNISPETFYFVFFLLTAAIIGFYFVSMQVSNSVLLVTKLRCKISMAS